MENIRTASLDGVEKKQIEEWLRLTDTHIRAGRYIAADELLQKVFTVHPTSEPARAYQDRIQFLIKQLSQRVGLEDDMYNEIIKYRQLLSKRNANHINVLLGSAQKFIEEGNFKKASDQAKKALALDHENIFAKELLNRLAELQARGDDVLLKTERETKYSSLLKESWRNGAPTESQQQIMRKIQAQLHINDGRVLELERTVKNILYKEALNEIWLTGGLSAFTTELVDQLREKYKVSRVDHSVIESALLKEVRKNKIIGNVLVVDGDENTLIELSSKLRSNYFAVISAGNMDEALFSLKNVTPDIILSELKFEDEFLGFNLFEFVRTTAPTKAIPFMFITKSADRSTMLIGKRLGVEEFIPKPIDYEMLIATISGKLRKLNNASQRRA